MFLFIVVDLVYACYWVEGGRDQKMKARKAVCVWKRRPISPYIASVPHVVFSLKHWSITHMLRHTATPPPQKKINPTIMHLNFRLDPWPDVSSFKNNNQSFFIIIFRLPAIHCHNLRTAVITAAGQSAAMRLQYLVWVTKSQVYISMISKKHTDGWGTNS